MKHRKTNLFPPNLRNIPLKSDDSNFQFKESDFSKGWPLYNCKTQYLVTSFQLFYVDK